MFIKFIKNKSLLYVVLLIAVLLSFLWLCKALFLTGYPDFQVHYFGAEHLIHGENPYLPDEKYFTNQVYPPFDMVFAIPFILFDFQTAARLWITISIGAVIFAIYLINKIYKNPIISPVSLWIYILVFLSFPVKFTLGMGQINTIILLFVVSVIYLINKKKDIYAGILLAFPIVIKFFPLLLVPYFVFLKKWKLLFAFLSAFMFLNFMTLLFFTPQVLINFYTHTLPELLSSWKADYYNQAMTGLIARSISDTEMRNIYRIAIPPLLLIINIIPIFLRKKKSRERINLEIASILTLSVLINNFSWQHHFVFLIFPFIIIAFTLQKIHVNRGVYLLLGLSYILVAVNLKNPEYVPILFQSHVFFGGLIIWILSIYTLIKYKF